jgi:hypothetical protein
VLKKVRGPATAAGAVLLGAAGVVAARNGGTSRRSGILPGKRSGILSGGRGPSLPKTGISKALRKQALPALKKGLDGIELPKPDGSMIDWVEERAKNVGDTSYRVAELTSQARGVQKALSGEK